MYQNWYCQSCGIYPFAMQAPMPYALPKKDDSKLLIWIVVIIVILIVVVPIALAAIMFFSVSNMMTTTSTTPTGALDFTESSTTSDMYSGAFVSLSSSVDIPDTSVTIVDDSLGASTTQNPLNPGTTLEVAGGMSFIYQDNNGDNNLDGGDTLRINDGNPGDIIRFVYRPTGGVIAQYTFV
jgi:FlaG/FlaF family flagellin (archaellin)